MATSIVAADSLLAVDVGTINTRAILFDVVEGRYRFIARGIARSTSGAPYHNIGEGVRLAIENLQQVTGRRFLNDDHSLIIPSGADGAGIDTFAFTMSGGAPVRVVVAGLLDDVSIASAKRFVRMVYSRLAGVVSLNSHRKQEERIDAIIRARPDLVVIAGGTDGGATDSVMKMVEAVGLACYLMPTNIRPEIIYVGNKKLQKTVQESLSMLGTIHVGENIRPSTETEQLIPAQKVLINRYKTIKTRNIPGVAEVDLWSGNRMLPTATAFGRIIRFLSQLYDADKGVLGVDVGASATTIAAGFSGALKMSVLTDLGLGENLSALLRLVKAESIARWLYDEDITVDDVRDFIFNKAAHPLSLSVTEQEWQIEQAVVKQLMQIAMADIRAQLKGTRYAQRLWFEPVVVSGGVLANAPKYAHTMMMVLDGLQPAGVTTVVLDKNSLTPALGAAAAINQILVAQVLESDVYLNLGAVIAPVGRARPATPVIRVWIPQPDGSEKSIDVKYGSIEVIPVPLGKKVELRVQPLQRFDIGMGSPGRGGRIRVVGGVLGVIIDARGRPLYLHPDDARRREMMQKWLWTLGG